MNRKIKNILLFIIFSLVLISLTTISYAASFTPGISATNIKVGDTITITVKADNAAGMYNIKVSDSSILEVISGSTSEFLENNSATIKLKAKKAGTTTVSVTPSDMTDLDNSTKPVTAGGKTYTVKVTEVTSTTDKDTTTDKNTSSSDKGTSTTNKDTTTTEKPKEKSTNAYLKTLGVRIKDSLAEELGIKTNEYDFSGFSKTKTSYNVTVPKNVDSLKVVATAADSNATVKVSGNSGFEVGSNNKITIKVTAEDGKTTKTYTIKVTRLAEEEEKPGNVIEDEKGLYLTSLELEGIELSPEFAKDTYSYTAKLDDADETKIKVNAKANIEDANIDISGNTNLVDGENTINIVVTLDGSEEQTVYQVILTKVEKVATVTDTENTNSEGSGTLTDLMGNLKTYIIIAVAVVVFMIVAVIVLIILLRRENRKLNEVEEIEEKAEEYNVYKNDVNEFENKTSEADNFIESLYRQRNGNLYNEEELDEAEKQTLEEINRETDKIFADKVEGQTVEYILDEVEERRPRRKSKGKHSK